MIRLAVGLCAGLALVLAPASCSSQRRGEPVAAAFVPGTAMESAGERVFMRHCHECHPGGMRGLGPAINDKPLPEWLIKFQVRNGLGAMPAFDEGQIADAELDALAAYVIALRKHKPPAGAVGYEMSSPD